MSSTPIPAPSMVKSSVDLRAETVCAYGTTSPPMPRFVSGKSEASCAAMVAACVLPERY
jgi:hypothetical protein